MDLPDFDTLKALAITEPAQLDAILQQQLAQLMARADPEHKRRLLGVQFQIDCQRKLAKNNMDSCIRIISMMRESFDLMRSEMNHFTDQENNFIPAEKKNEGNIVLLSQPNTSRP
ncbi:DUF3135 domain-containing protein [Aeromonas cavernicola]|uniref:DUF3135 domain-containing protein n=1 Tax=Aeromonas cavernicola TaxID=1006623 RepID=A0A2H9U3Z0_9GAMM|nr:DUF3135 domain-containing protein [Aeromonas cavernicola]PJG58762.1 DUF3135 domain-containing protein [Aeromonas cavernicola]